MFAFTVLACCAGPITQNRADADLWGHIQFGRDVLDSGSLPATTTYSYTAEGYRWINHENLSELTFALTERIGGTIGLLLLKFFLGLVVLTLIYRTMERQGVSMAACAAVLLLVSYNLLYHWTLRPQLASYTLFACMLAIFHWCFQGWQGSWHFTRAPNDLVYSSRRLRWLWTLPVVTFVWVNSHGGFVAGCAVLVLYLAGRSAEAFWVRGRDSWPLQRRLLMMASAAILATFVNPYGPRMQWWLLQSLGRPRPEIMEWLPPTLADPMSLPFWLMLAFASLTIVASKRCRDFTHLLLLGATGWQALLHQRHAAFFAITCGFYLGPHLDSVIHGASLQAKLRSWLEPRLKARVAIAAVLLIGVAGQLWHVSGRMRYLPVRHEEFPCAAVQFMADNRMDGNIVVPYRWSQYVIASLAVKESPVRVKVAFDGRYRTCYPQALVDIYFDFMFGIDGPLKRFRHPCSPEYDPTRILRYAPPGQSPPDIVMVNVRQPHAIEVLKGEREEWMPVFSDGVCQLWARRAVFDHPERPRYIPPSVRVFRDEPLAGAVHWPALPTFGRTDSIIRHVSLAAPSSDREQQSSAQQGEGATP